MKYATRRKEPVVGVSHVTELDGTVAVHPFKAYKQWVYTREDGSEFVNLRKAIPVYRKDGVAHYDTFCKVIPAFSFQTLQAKLAGSTPVNLGNGLVAFVKPKKEDGSEDDNA